MKLTVKQGVSVEKALGYIDKILKEQYGDYGILKGNMNVYVTLKDDENRSCPDNEKEYLLSADETVDIEEKIILAKMDELLDGWERYYSVQQKKVGKAQNELNSAIRNLEMAEKKGLTDKTIESRKRAVARCQTELEETIESAELFEILNERVVKNDIKKCFTRKKSSASSYSYTITPYIIFEDVDGEDWHFVGFQNRYEQPYGMLSAGLPSGYEKE